MTDVSQQMRQKYKKDEIDQFQQFVVSDELNKSYKITNEFNILIKKAIESRIDATAEYTKHRIKRINRNYELYHHTEEVLADANAKTIFCAINSEINDFVDDVYSTLQSFESAISIRDPKGICDTEISRTYQTDLQDIRKKSFMSGIFRFLKNRNQTDQFISESEYFFNKKQLVMKVLEYLVNDSDINKQSSSSIGRDNLEYFLYQGIISGMFALVNRFEPEDFTEIEISDTGQNSVVLNKRNKFKFCPVDTRSLIFSKTSLDWFAEVKRVSFSSLLASATDPDGNQNEYSPYDLERLKELSVYIREKRHIPSVKDMQSDTYMPDLFLDESQIEEMNRIDAMIKVYEFHYVPIQFPGEKKMSRSYITAVSFDDEPGEMLSPALFVIGIRKTPFIHGLPLHVTRFHERLIDNDIQGIGLPEMLESLESRLNQVTIDVCDLIQLSLLGLTVYDKDKVMNPNQLENLSRRGLIQVKNLNGSPVNSVIQNIKPDPQSIAFGQNWGEKLEQKIKRVSRTGLGGNSIKSSQVSATEFQSVASELQKQTNRSSIKIGKLLEGWLLDLYRYSAMFRDDEISVILNGFRTRNDVDQAENEITGEYHELFEAEKRLNIKSLDWFVNGIGFEIMSFEAKANEAIERQQQMEGLQIAMKFAVNPMTGQPMQFEDDNGQPVMINISGIVKDVFDSLGIDNVFKPYQQSEMPMPAIGPQSGPIQPGTTPGMNQPKSTASGVAMPQIGQFPTGVKP